jgi:hypothetical protein
MNNFDVDKFNDIFLENIFLPFVEEKSQKDIYSNTLDLFSAKIDCILQEITPELWVSKEKSRQAQKTLQNKIGTFHQQVSGCFDGWEDLGTGAVVDVVNKDKKIIAEIKNKHNTTKGNHKVAIYDDLEFLLEGKYEGYTGFFVEILPLKRKIYNKEFTPSDNKTKSRRKARNDIRVIDGLSWYKLISSSENFVSVLYKKLLVDAFKYSNNSVEDKLKISINQSIASDPMFNVFLNMTFDLDK